MASKFEKKMKRLPQPETGLSIFRTMMLVAMVGQGLAFVLLFLAVVASPVASRLIGGLGGADATFRMSLMLGLLASLRCWLAGIIESRDETELVPFDPSAPKPLAPRWHRLALLYLFLVCVSVFTWGIRQPASWGLVTGHDQPQYFSYLHSWVFDHDLQFKNEYEKISGAIELLTSASGTGAQTYNVAPVGTPVLWLPFYLLSHGAVLFLRWFGLDSPADGLSSPYATGVAFGNLVLVWLGMLMVYEVVRRICSGPSAFFAVLLLWLTTPILWYVLDEAWMSHGCSFFAGSLVLYLWSKDPLRRSQGGWALLGAAVGLAMLVRPSEVVLCLLLVIDLLVRARAEGRALSFLRPMAITFACMLGVFSLQLITWYCKTGMNPPPGSPMQWGDPALVSFLFSSRHGLFSWHPVTWLGFLGVPLIWKRSQRSAIAIGLVLALSLYVNASIESWWGGAAFGARRFISVLPFMALGVAAAGTWTIGLFRRRPWILASVFILALALYNQLLTKQFREHWFNPGDAVWFQRVWVTSSMLFQARFGNPFSYPANLWFAVRNGVSPGQYDLLAGAKPAELTIDAAGSELQTYLGQGWARDPWHWHTPNPSVAAEQQNCTLLLPLEQGRKYELSLQLAPPPNLDQPQVVSLALGKKELGRVTFAKNAGMNVKLTLPESDVKEGLNTLTLSFAQIKALPFGRRGVALGKGLEVRTGRRQSCAGYLIRLVARRQE